MPPQQPQNPPDPNQQQSIQPQPVISQVPQPSVYQQPPAPNTSSSTPSNWNTLFILSLVFDVIIPIVGLILGEVLYRKAKAADDDAWRKKAKWSIYFGCLVMIIIFAVLLSKAFIRAKNDTSQGSDTQYSQPLGKSGSPDDTQAGLNMAAAEEVINKYDSNPNNLPTGKGGFLSDPTLAQLQDKTWRAAHGLTIDRTLFVPNSIGDTLTFISGTPTRYDQFGYVPHPAGCLDTASSPCTGYTITAKKSSGVLTDKSYDYTSNN